MTFNFDGGDILILLLVGIALYLFHRFDRTGRSLEKVRRYAEKSKGELDAIVHERELGLKDLSADLEVQERTNREILARADAAREEIIARASDLEDRVEKIEAHERALSELNDLALRVDENLSRLRDESVYVDQVGARLSDIKDKFTSLAEKDAARFASFREESLGIYGEGLNHLKSGLEESTQLLHQHRESLEVLNAHRDAAMEERLSVFKEGLAQVETDYHERLAKVAQEGLQLEDDAFAALNEKIENRTERLETNWLGGLNELKNDVSGTAEEIRLTLNDSRENLASWEAESAERMQGLRDSSEEFENQQNAVLGTLRQLLEESEQSLQSTFSQARHELEESWNSTKEGLEGRFETERHRLDHALHDGISQIEQQVEKETSHLEHRMNQAELQWQERYDSGIGMMDQKLEESTTALQAALDHRYTIVESNLEDQHQTLHQHLQTASHDLENTIQSGVEDLERRLSSKVESAQSQGLEKMSQFEHQFRNDLEALDSQYRSQIEKLQSILAETDESLRRDFATTHDELESHLRTTSEQLRNQWDDKAQAVEQSIAQTLQDWNERFDEGVEGMEQRMQQASQDFRSRLDSGETSFLERVENFETQLSQRLQQEKSDLEGRMDTHYSSLDGKLESGVLRLDTGIDELRGKVDDFLENRESELLEGIEIRQDQYRRTVESRFESIEEFIRDMDSLAESLKASQKQTLADIESTFSQFDQDLTERRNVEREHLEEEAAAMRQEMVNLEQGLDDLKARAYDNVTEKLQVFEDEFFADLKTRDGAMRAAMEEWRGNAENELAELAQRATRERDEVERRYANDLKQRLTDLQTRIFGQFDGFQDQVDGFRDTLNDQIRGADETLLGLREELSARIARERDSASVEFQKAMEIHERDVAEKFTRSGKEISQRLTAFAGDIETRHRELSAAFQSARDEMSQWRERMAIQKDDALRTVQEQLALLSDDVSERIAEIRDEYAGKTEQLILESGEERANLRREINSLEDNVNRLSTEVEQNSKESLESLHQAGENFLFEFRKSSREARDEGERKIKELRQALQDAREKSELHRQEMTDQVEGEYQRIMRNLEEIDKRQREFVAESRVFERADEMKVALEADIAELLRQQEVVGAHREEIQGIQEDYQRAISLYDEVSTKLSRFLSEQQKVENLEGKIARIGGLSESVDLKLSQMTEAHDALQDLQVRLRQMEDLHEDLGGRYQRLAEKSNVLDAATKGVDENFQRMTELEQRQKDISLQLPPLLEALAAAEGRQQQLEQDRAKIEHVSNKAAAVDSTLEELDKRLEDLGKAREWLARTETRLEEINTEAQQKVRLLGTLAKREGGTRKSAGSPDMSTREVVVKLAREGWNSEEIARTTKLSRGEVELILELTPNS